MLASENNARKVFFERLPEDKPGDVSPTNLAALVAIAIFSLIAINLSARFFLDHYSPNLGFWLIRHKWDLLLNMQDSQDVLILGDSAGNQGLVPEVILEETGLKTINLATIANLTFLNDDWMLKEYLKRFPPPKIILIMNTYQTWHRSANLQSVNTIPFLNIPDRDDVLTPGTNGTVMDRFVQFVLHYFPAYSESGSLRTLLRPTFQIPPDFRLITQNNYSLSPLGTYVVTQQVPHDLKQDIERHLLSLQSESSISDENIRGLEELKRIAGNYDFQVFLINAPIDEVVANSADFPRYFETIANYLQKFAESTTNIHYIGEQLSYPNEDMQSADHLLYNAAITFTHHIAMLLFR